MNQLEDITNDENAVNSKTRVCCIVGYPFGQTSTAAKVAEAKCAVRDGAARIR